MIATYARVRFIEVRFLAAIAMTTVALATCFAAGRAQAQAQAVQGGAEYAALLAAPDRSDNDKQADKRRDPLPFLQFTAPRPGMKVLDMGAGGGYSTELMARAVAPNGMVYGQNPADASDKMKASFDARLATPGMKDAAADVRPFDDPAPPGVPLDMITFLFFYHDTTYMGVDRVAMDKAMFAALKPGGVLVIADHAALPGQGTTVGKTLHRIEQSTLRQELEAAGFKFVAEGNFWKNDADTHDYPSFKKDVPIDNFVLKFQKPN
jgi:predicted methyltransferase